MGDIERRFRGTLRLPVSESRSERLPDLNASEGESEEIEETDSWRMARFFMAMTSAHSDASGVLGTREALKWVVGGVGEVIGDAEFKRSGRGECLGVGTGDFAIDSKYFVLWTKESGFWLPVFWGLIAGEEVIDDEVVELEL